MTSATANATRPLTEAKRYTPKPPPGYGRLHKPVKDGGMGSLHCVSAPVPAFLADVKPLPANPTTDDIFRAAGVVSVVYRMMNALHNTLHTLAGEHGRKGAEAERVWRDACFSIEGAMGDVDAIACELAATNLGLIVAGQRNDDDATNPTA